MKHDDFTMQIWSKRCTEWAEEKLKYLEKEKRKCAENLDKILNGGKYE